MSVVPIGDRLVVGELTAHEKEQLGFPIGTTGAVDVGVVMAISDDCELAGKLNVGDRVFHRCKGPKVGTESQMVDAGCVVGYEPKEDT